MWDNESFGSMHDWMDGGGWVWPTLMMVVLLIAVAALGVLLWQGGRRPRGAASEPTALLEGRYARGEIDDEEYARRRAVLTEG